MNYLLLYDFCRCGKTKTILSKCCTSPLLSPYLFLSVIYLFLFRIFYSFSQFIFIFQMSNFLISKTQSFSHVYNFLIKTDRIKILTTLYTPFPHTCIFVFYSFAPVAEGCVLVLRPVPF